MPLALKLSSPLRAWRNYRWLFFGHRLTGLPFDTVISQGLMILAAHVSTVLENALLYEEVTVQKILAETLLESIPRASSPSMRTASFRWFNPPPNPILGLKTIEAPTVPLKRWPKAATLVRET